MTDQQRLPGSPSSLLRTITAKRDYPVEIFVSPAFAECYIEFVEEYGITVRVKLDIESTCKVVAAFDRAVLYSQDRAELATGGPSMNERWKQARDWLKNKGLLR